MKVIACFIITLLIICNVCLSQQQKSYAELLGYPAGAKVIIMHVDDVGMSFDSNQGAIDAMEKGVANSCSIMMPCPWVPQFVKYLKDHPNTDAGLHLTLTSEWENYRWGPLAGKAAIPGLVDSSGDLWASVPQVVLHATPEEVGKEIAAQIDRSKTMGWQPTHLDSHMGTLFASPAFMHQYVQAGIQNKIPVMFPAGEATLIQKQQGFSNDMMDQLRTVGKMLWSAGLPVLDDLYNESYEWKIPEDIKSSPKKLQDFKTEKYIEALKAIRPGITMIIMHCTNPTEVFKYISDSGPTRQADLLAMEDPRLKDYIKKNGIIFTTWRELKERRDKVK